MYCGLNIARMQFEETVMLRIGILERPKTLEMRRKRVGNGGRKLEGGGREGGGRERR